MLTIKKMEPEKGGGQMRDERHWFFGILQKLKFDLANLEGKF